MPLPVTVVHHVDETPESLCDRLSVANGFSSKRIFLTMTGIKAPALAKADPGAIRRLANWSGENIADLERNRITTRPRRLDWQLGSAVFNKQARCGKRFRYCPNCVVDDIKTGRGRPVSRPYVRAAWMSRAVTNCVRHARPIVEIAVASKADDSFCRFVATNSAKIHQEADSSVPTEFVAVDAYAQDRMLGALKEPYLDRFEAHVAIDLCVYLGKFLKRHRSAFSLIPEDLRKAPTRELGFHYARKGATAIREIVVDVINKIRPNGLHKFFFAALGRWLRSNSNEPEFSEVLDLFQDVAERNLPFAAGEMCFVTVRKRYLHSVVSAGAEYGLHEERVVQLMHEAGLIETSQLAHGRIYFDAAKAHDILVAATKTLTSRQAREELGVTEHVMAGLLDSGLLARVEPRTETRVYSRIRREDLDKLRDSIFDQVVGIHESNRTPIPIERVCQYAACEVVDVLAAVIGGHLRKVFISPNDKPRIASLRFDRDEAVAHLSKVRPTLSAIAGRAVMNQRAASAYLRAKPTTVPYLINLGLLETVEIINPVNGRLQLAVTVESMDLFQRDHILVSEVAARHETHPNTILDLFAKIEVRPIYDNCGNVSRFFLRSEVLDAPIEVRRYKRK
ncbi:TniQ family protein [Rhizobium leguminosarum]|uniref:TniQ family protein n=1 Tax=Rhizobium leguminosarum TaxID=384 RepID=UPI0012FCDD4B|nr:TniQ family protein [Rhizobium leguminosarum]